MPVMEGKKKLSGNDGFDIQVQNISFGYTKNKRIINNTSMSIPFGSLIAIAGLSGGGKMIVCNLIGRFLMLMRGKFLSEE